MKKNKKYGVLINEKFGELSYPDMDTTWPDMKAILDREMPRRKRRFFFWFNSITVIAAVSAITGFAIYSYNNNRTEHEQTVNGQVLHQTSATRKQPSASATNQNFAGEAKQDHESRENSKSPQTAGNALTTHSRQTQTTTTAYAESPGTTVLPAPKISAGEITTEQNVNSKGRSMETATNDFAVAQPNFRINRTLSVDLALNKKIHDVNNYRLQDLLQAGGLRMQPVTDNATVKKTNHLPKIKGWVMGASVNYNLPVSSQEMSTVNSKGERNTLIDFLPSVYLQYHFNGKWHLETAFQFSAPQYTSAHKLASEFTPIDPDKKEENAIWLNKLYYLNVPLSVHFRPMPHLTIGTGIQYSYLRRSLFDEEIASWENGPDGWKKVSSVKNIKIKSNATVKKDKSNNGNSNGNGGNGNGNSGNGNGNGNSGNGNGNGNGNSGGNGNGNNGNGNGNGNSGGNGNGNNGNSNGNGNSGGNTGSGTNGNPVVTAPLTRVDTVAQTLRSSDWRVLLDLNYNWRRINVGCRFNFGLNNYINTQSGNSILPVKDRNQALQFYLRYDIFTKLKKR